MWGLHGGYGRTTDPVVRHNAILGRRRPNRHAFRTWHAGATASATDRLYRGTGAAMRLLRERLNDDRRRLPERQEETDGFRDQRRVAGAEMPLRNACKHPEGGQTRRRND